MRGGCGGVSARHVFACATHEPLCLQFRWALLRGGRTRGAGLPRDVVESYNLAGRRVEVVVGIDLSFRADDKLGEAVHNNLE